ncbi:MAG: transglycosylase SLT domain-containing protein [Rhodobacterales bacterium]|nr:transglycosylase SLT domain-containing protein [Rhodobacterales bacterium]
MTIRAMLAGLMLTLPMACAAATVGDAGAMPAMRWDHRPEAMIWTARTLDALDPAANALPQIVPEDIATWCPAYPRADAQDRAAFWAGLLSALAKHESTWNPAASGGGGRWIGLVQIAPGTARSYGCAAQNTAELKDGAENLSCAVRIAAVQVGRDNKVAGGRGTEGLGRDWAPFRSAAKRAEMAACTRAQDYCQL